MAVSLTCSSSSAPSLGTSVCHRCDRRKKNKPNQTKNHGNGRYYKTSLSKVLRDPKIQAVLSAKMTKVTVEPEYLSIVKLIMCFIKTNKSSLFLCCLRKFSQHRNTYQRSRTPPPGPPGEDHFQRRYSWNVKPNTSHATQNKRWYSSSYHRPSYPKYYGWTEWDKPTLETEQDWRQLEWLFIGSGQMTFIIYFTAPLCVQA